MLIIGTLDWIFVSAQKAEANSLLSSFFTMWVGPENPVFGADCALDLGFSRFLRYFFLLKSSKSAV